MIFDIEDNKIHLSDNYLTYVYSLTGDFFKIKSKDILSKNILYNKEIYVLSNNGRIIYIYNEFFNKKNINLPCKIDSFQIEKDRIYCYHTHGILIYQLTYK